MLIVTDRSFDWLNTSSQIRPRCPWRCLGFVDQTNVNFCLARLKSCTIIPKLVITARNVEPTNSLCRGDPSAKATHLLGFSSISCVTWVLVLRKLMATRYTTAFVLPYKLLVSPLSPTNKTKSVKRIVGEASWQHLLQKLCAPELQLVMGSNSTLACYELFSKKNKLPINVEKIEGADARLLWLGEKRTDRVIYFMHGMYLTVPGLTWSWTLCTQVADSTCLYKSSIRPFWNMSKTNWLIKGSLLVSPFSITVSTRLFSQFTRFTNSPFFF